MRYWIFRYAELRLAMERSERGVSWRWYAALLGWLIATATILGTPGISL